MNDLCCLHLVEQTHREVGATRPCYLLCHHASRRGQTAPQYNPALTDVVRSLVDENECCPWHSRTATLLPSIMVRIRFTISEYAAASVASSRWRSGASNECADLLRRKQSKSACHANAIRGTTPLASRSSKTRPGRLFSASVNDGIQITRVWSGNWNAICSRRSPLPLSETALKKATHHELD